jgi:hypothetical protein
MECMEQTFIYHTMNKDYLDPYHRLGLKHNPFIVTVNVGVPAWLWLDFGLETPIPGRKQFIQLMGEKGAGKTSHLLHWQKQTQGSYCYYPPGREAWKVPPVEKISYWDEADRIPYPFLLYALSKASKQHSTIVVGTHKDLSGVARGFGLQVHKTTLYTLTLESLNIWVKKRLENTLLEGVRESKLKLTKDVAQDIVLKAGSSWREAAVLLHIWAANSASYQGKSL